MRAVGSRVQEGFVEVLAALVIVAFGSLLGLAEGLPKALLRGSARGTLEQQPKNLAAPECRSPQRAQAPRTHGRRMRSWSPESRNSRSL